MFEINEKEVLAGPRPGWGKRGDLPLKIGVEKKRSKNYKKMFDDSVAILIVTGTSADASRYLVVR